MEGEIEGELTWVLAALAEVQARLQRVLEGRIVAPPPVEPPVEPVQFPVYSQRDPRWQGDQLGPDRGGGTIGGAGCAVTCAAMVATAAGCQVTPGELNRWLCENAGFTGAPRNLLNWEKMAAFCPVLEWRGKRVWREGPADMEMVRRELEWGPVIAEVDFDYTDRDVDQHFVVLLEMEGDDEAEIADPWDGMRVGLVERYFNPEWAAPDGKVARVITGLRLLVAKC